MTTQISLVALFSVQNYSDIVDTKNKSATLENAHYGQPNRLRCANLLAPRYHCYLVSGCRMNLDHLCEQYVQKAIAWATIRHNLTNRNSEPEYLVRILQNPSLACSCRFIHLEWLHSECSQAILLGMLFKIRRRRPASVFALARTTWEIRRRNALDK